MSLARRLAAVALLSVTSAVTAEAQRVEPVAKQADSSDSKATSLITRRDVAVAGSLAAATVVLMPFDAKLAAQLRAPNVQSSRAWHDGAVIFDWYGAPGAMYAGPVLALAGSVTRSPRVFDAGVHVTESYAAAALVTVDVEGACRSRASVHVHRERDDRLQLRARSRLSASRAL